ncbi:hypothetical protein [uncultured Desulfovibrio sp.]|uniref:hypothetical protein n=1 Tax=uncultured Desulfovibrio sp. TaxID=167968 RepID=UPI00262F6B52|nr:hypothetical protein [uncultured Desulfovibrio sp.]
MFPFRRSASCPILFIRPGTSWAWIWRFPFCGVFRWNFLQTAEQLPQVRKEAGGAATQAGKTRKIFRQPAEAQAPHPAVRITGSADVRNGFPRKAIATISKKHAAVAVEDLQVQNMYRPASGTVDRRGKMCMPNPA